MTIPPLAHLLPALAERCEADRSMYRPDPWGGWTLCAGTIPKCRIYRGLVRQ